MFKILDLEALLALNSKEYSAYMNKVIRAVCLLAMISLAGCWLELYFTGEHIGRIFEIGKAFGSLAAIFSLVIVLMQTCIARTHKQTSIDLQKSYKAIELIYEWSKDSSAEMLLVRKIVDRMKVEEVKKLADGNSPVMISMDDYRMLSGFLPNKIDKATKKEKKRERKKKKRQKREETHEGKFIGYNDCRHQGNCPVANSQLLSMAETLWLRSWVIKYLNILEVIMYAWKANFVNRDVIEKEFSYLVKSERDGSVVLKELRDMLGQESFPGIYSFCEELSKKNKKRIIEETYMG